MLTSRRGLLIVDMQQDFVAPHGALSVRCAKELIPQIRAEIETARRNGDLVIWTQDWHPERTAHFAAFGGTWPTHCVAGTDGAEVVPELATLQEPHDLLIRKGVAGEDGYSAFSVRDPILGEAAPTDLHDRLKERAIQQVRICGVATDWCVKSTALDALRLGYTVEVIRTGIAAVALNPDDEEVALNEITAAGGVLI
ncbi:MAG: isochorismatase family protein [Candidatus Limnocylindrus sp.]